MSGVEDPNSTWRMRFWKIPKKCFLLLFPSSTFFKFFIAALIPALSDNLIPLFFVGQIPNESALAISAQFIFISVFLEVLQEGIVNSMSNFIGQNYREKRVVSLQGLKICLTILLTLGSIFTLGICLLSKQFVQFIGTPETIAGATQRFLWISSFSFPLFLCNAALSDFMYITTSSLLVFAQLSQVTLSFLTNFFLFGQQSLSLHWGLEQLGYYKLIQSFLNLTNNLIFLHLIEKITPFNFLFKIPLLENLAANLKSLLRISWGNFGDSAVRNFFYFMVTLKFINNLGETEAGAWNLLNTIIWGLFLIPSYTVAKYVRVEVGLASGDTRHLKSVIKTVARGSLICLSLWLCIVGISGTLTWSHLAQYFSPSNIRVQEMSAQMFYQVGWIYIVFSFNGMDSLFFGTGKTQYIFYQSLFTNMIVYFIPWVLYLGGILTPSYWWVVGLYFGGMLVDFGLTSYFCIVLWRNIPASVYEDLS